MKTLLIILGVLIVSRTIFVYWWLGIDVLLVFIVLLSTLLLLKIVKSKKLRMEFWLDATKPMFLKILLAAILVALISFILFGVMINIRSQTLY